ncbi:PEP-utilizing enzyme [Rhodococcoides kyotonense]|uniref:Pyruvate, water dikinase n=1 Tax=Rhodococcoides kyotonense TaxID=398843 RepID=A0A239I280_9NOCA|nr:PEP-utilizing enzyme [Rhodococcus kyotonensis]SNS87368.1 pyruvate, water dikinase [Rhodococcus kyotonensis]
MAEQRWLVDTVPSTRLPVYTRLNASDVLSDPITPLGADLGWIQNILPGWNFGYASLGSYSLAEKPDVAASSGIFYGHLYINLSMSRLVGIRGGLPVELVDQLFYGGDPNIPAYVGHPDDENADATARLKERNAWALSTETFPELEEDRVLADRLRSERPDLATLTPAALVARARSVMPLERVAWRGEVVATNSAAVGPAVLGQLLGADRQDLVVALIGAAGDVDSALPSYALWELGRLVRSNDELMEVFDAGLDGIGARIAGLDSKFDAMVDRFLLDFGYRGPNEWDLGSVSWETQPQLVFGLVERLRLQDDSASPSDRRADHAASTEDALAQARAIVGEDDEGQATLTAALASARRFAAWRERAKTNCIKVLHEARVPLVELGRRLHSDGHLESADHVFMAVDDELDALATAPESMKETLAVRHREWKQLFGLELPTFLDTREPLPALSTLGRRGHSTVEPAKQGEMLHGSGASPGITRGRTRVITSMAKLDEFEAGEILVAPQTDPSWTPLFMVSAGAITDVGAMGSHAMIVSRELGIPCAAGVPNATRRIPNGALVEIDGSKGTVTIVELP